MNTVQAEYRQEPEAAAANKRRAERRRIEVPARLTWKDRHGTTRMATVRTRDVSEQGVLVECVSSCSIPLFRLVDLHVDRAARGRPELPASLRRPQVLAAVYRIGPYSDVTGTPQSYALRLLVKPERRDEPAVRGRERSASLAATAARHTA